MIEVFETSLAEFFISNNRLNVSLADLTVGRWLAAHFCRLFCHVGTKEVIKALFVDNLVESSD